MEQQAEAEVAGVTGLGDVLRLKGAGIAALDDEPKSLRGSARLEDGGRGDEGGKNGRDGKKGELHVRESGVLGR